ncbi:alpha/beta fold hydrolase BchO [Paracraurococcus lichenis]|uniref:Alpha/beta fold hydrolase n=1 Tax=Paracraurococcus lichenis TaxID=3064888 RepID=A0ABT9DU84_9PROT|nr:alpha/beta fold hydrolase BchO [Paracraurococcus sp. LOR1-02]MDO9707468.1 alpha/beta fold hydrolase [Paracraurococcus sp. LOR1-02]
MIPADWPNRAQSRIVAAGGLRWHVQVAGSGPVLLLVHGTGAATHSWRDLLPVLARRFTVVAPDLPGHGFSERPEARGLSLPGMARGLAALLRALGLAPALAAGHSAGAAVIARMTLDGAMAPRALIGLNAALLPFEGLAGQLFAPMARMLAGVPAVPWFFAWRAGDRSVVERLLRDTGSTLDARGVELYGRLVRQPGHVAAALGMMASWELRPLLRDLRGLKVPLVLIVGGHDRTVSPADARRIRAAVPQARIIDLPSLGHLAHEERPEEVAAIIARVAAEQGLLATETA